MIFPEAQETSGTPHAVGRFHLGRVGKNPADRAPVRILQYATRDLAGSMPAKAGRSRRGTPRGRPPMRPRLPAGFCQPGTPRGSVSPGL